jgi:hypothetical protein
VRGARRGKQHTRLERGGIFDAQGTIRFEYLMRTRRANLNVRRVRFVDRSSTSNVRI